MKPAAALSLLFSLHIHWSLAYKPPAPVSAVQPDPQAYLHWLPNNPQHGHFSSKNQSVNPWHPHPPWPHPPYPPPRQCSGQNPYPQQQFLLPNVPHQQFWLPNVPHQGTSPFLVNGLSYQVYRNVKNFGAKGDGSTDDTAAFNAAINYGGRCSGGQCAGGTTGKPALIYVPPGIYIISTTIQLYVDTQIVGDAINLPILKAAANVANGTVIVGGFDPGTGSTTNFYIGVRNLNIDTAAADPTHMIYALNWAVSQATNLINVNFFLAPNSQHVGIEMNGGSGGGGSGTFMGDLTFSGGLMGIQLNNQQYAFKNMQFTNVATAIAIQHAFVVTMEQISCYNVGICVDMGGQGVTGSLNLIDSACNTCGIVVNGSASLIMENVEVINSGPTLFVNGTSKIRGTLAGKTYALGHIYYNNTDAVINSEGTYLPYTRRGSQLTDGNGLYYTKPQPQYTHYPASAFVSVKDVGATGDGQTDDTAALQAALLANANCKITYFPHGVYLITSTLYVPPGSRIVGEVWSVLSASGSKFTDDADPKVMLQIGRPGEVGVAEISDMLFTVADVLPGAILVEVNMRGANQGDVSFHNSHYRVGGAADSRTETACQTTSQPCKAAFLLTYLTKSSSTYIENAWLWAADHDLDGTYNQQIGTGRGMLIEATEGTWLVGTASEHHVLYAYQMNGAQNVMASMMQVETPYFQPSPKAPNPWTPNATWHDPDFSGCAANGSLPQCYMQWALRIIGSETHTLPLYGQGFWVFFNGPNYGACTGPGGTCQINIVDFEGVDTCSAVELYNLNTRGLENMVTIGGSGGDVAATQAENPGSWGGVLAAYLGYE